MTDRLTRAVMIMLGIIAGGFLLLVGVKYIFPVFLPFLIAWAVAGAVKRPAELISERIKLPVRVTRLLLAALLMLCVLGLAVLGVWQLLTALWDFLSEFGEGNVLYDFLLRLEDMRLPFLDGELSGELSLRLREALDGLLSSALSSIARAVTSLGAALPDALLFILITAIALIYFALDLEKVNRAVLTHLPKKPKEILLRLGKNMKFMTKKYIRSYLLLMGITYLVVLVGLLLIGVDHAPLISLIIALLDVLPVIGVGTVLIPWCIFELALGSSAVGIGLAILFVLNTVLRQLLEPKLVGKSLDMHPVITLIILYVGYSLFGIGGIILTPVFALLVGALFSEEDHSAEIA